MARPRWNNAASRGVWLAWWLVPLSCQPSFHVNSNSIIACESDSQCPADAPCDSATGTCNFCDPACGGLTPTCKAGVCIADCAHHACGVGCCADETCHPGDTADACGSSGECVRCIGHPAGRVCINGACGCRGPLDCAEGEACVDGQCGIDCTPDAPCRGGCCDQGFQCRVGQENDACGNSGFACADCSSNSLGGACINGAACGCSEASDCANTPKGALCLADDSCGCEEADADCPPSHDCVGVDGAKRCQPLPCDGVSVLCGGTCCIPEGYPGAGSCNGVPHANACGYGALCLDCNPVGGTPNSAGTACVEGHCGCHTSADCEFAGSDGLACLPSQLCGCSSAADCPRGRLCDLDLAVCVAGNCADGKICNGCCDGTSTGTCLPGTSNHRCGGQGGVCINCTQNLLNSRCTDHRVCGLPL